MKHRPTYYLGETHRRRVSERWCVGLVWFAAIVLGVSAVVPAILYIP